MRQLKTISSDGIVIHSEQEVANQKLALVRSLRDRAEELWWEFGAALFEVYEHALYTALGYDNMVTYVQRELDITYSSVQKFISTHKWLNAFDADFQAWVHGIGSSKARLMTNKFLPEDAALWRTRLDGCSCREIEAIFKGQDPQLAGDVSPPSAPDPRPGTPLYGADGYDYGTAPIAGDPPARTVDDPQLFAIPASDPTVERPEVIHFSLFPEQRKNVDLAVDRAKRIALTEREGHALDLICSAFLSGEGFCSSPQEYLGHVERVLGLRLIAVQQNGKVIHGMELLEALVPE